MCSQLQLQLINRRSSKTKPIAHRLRGDTEVRAVPSRPLRCVCSQAGVRVRFTGFSRVPPCRTVQAATPDVVPVCDLLLDPPRLSSGLTEVPFGYPSVARLVHCDDGGHDDNSSTAYAAQQTGVTGASRRGVSTRHWQHCSWRAVPSRELVQLMVHDLLGREAKPLASVDCFGGRPPLFLIWLSPPTFAFFALFIAVPRCLGISIIMRHREHIHISEPQSSVSQVCGDRHASKKTTDYSYRQIAFTIPGKPPRAQACYVPQPRVRAPDSCSQSSFPPSQGLNFAAFHFHRGL